MAERQYTDEEAAAIFQQASEAETAALAAPGQGKGMTLAALQEIGREAGISPEAVALAARSLEAVGRPASRTFLGLRIGVGRTVEFDRPLSDTEWEGLVADLRTTFQARGAVRYDGPFRQWTNGNLQALLEPTPTGHRLRLQTVKGDSQRLMIAGGSVLGMAGVMAAVTTLSGSLSAGGALSGVGVMVLLGLGAFTAGGLRVPGWARQREAQFEEILQRLARSTARTEPDPK